MESFDVDFILNLIALLKDNRTRLCMARNEMQLRLFRRTTTTTTPPSNGGSIPWAPRYFACE